LLRRRIAFKVTGRPSRICGYLSEILGFFAGAGFAAFADGAKVG